MLMACMLFIQVILYKLQYSIEKRKISIALVSIFEKIHQDSLLLYQKIVLLEAKRRLHCVERHSKVYVPHVMLDSLFAVKGVAVATTVLIR
jgi:hypothetical protein